jgi:N-acyl-D-glutamate deacylase
MKRNVTLLAFAVTLAVACAGGAQEYDIVILSGRVMDPETMFDSVANVGIKDGIIATITKDGIRGKETVRAKGLVVAPGFIDTHTHSSDKFSIKMSMMDGVTTGLDMELGALNIAEWYEREAGKWPMNYGQAVSHEMVRMVIHDGLDISGATDATNIFDLRAASSKADGIEGWSVTVSNLDQINQISKILDENLRQGALGLANTVGYAKTGINTYEMFEAQRAAARYGRLTASHTRFHTSANPPQEATLGFDELFTNASLLDAPLLICHDNDYGWWEIEEKLSMARAKGMNMWAEYYPYASGSSAIGAEAFRPDSMKALGLVYSETMYDPSQDKYLSEEEYTQIAKDDPGRTVIVFNPPRVEWMKSWIKIPHMTVGSDAMWSTDKSLTWDSDPAKFSGHPRTSGTHTLVLRMGREAGVPLMFTLSQLSYWSALHLGDAGIASMQVRGRMQEGMVADIVIFDPEKVKEGSDYAAGLNGLPPKGLPHVIVNGQFVKRNNNATNVFPGVPIRYPVEEKGRFVPADVKELE